MHFSLAEISHYTNPLRPKLNLLNNIVVYLPIGTMFHQKASNGSQDDEQAEIMQLPTGWMVRILLTFLFIIT
jgi:hypothetical protein